MTSTSRSSATNLSALIRNSLSTTSFAFLHSLFATWLKLDLTTLAAALTIYGTLSGALKDLQGIAWKIYWYFTRFFTASISVASHDRLNREILNWLSAQILTRQGTRILTASTESTRSDAWSPREKTTRNDYYHEKRIPIRYLPTFGTTWFIHERHIFLVRRISSRTMFTSLTPDEYADVPSGDEPLVVMVLSRSVGPIKRFFEACRNFADKQREAFITVRASKSDYGREGWDTTILRPIRPLATVHFDKVVKEDLVADINNYLDPNTRRFYTERGIPYRRGYLLHGPPGTGKTSLSLALAGYFGLEIYLCHLPSISQDNELERLFSSLPSRCIVLLEDIDAVGASRKGHYDRSPEIEGGDKSDSDDSSSPPYERSRCTLSGLLNVLDGVSSQEGRIVLMTSNIAHNLDKALVRPGRIDKMIFLGNISSRSSELMFLRMYAPDDYSGKHEHDMYSTSNENLQKLALEFSGCIPDNMFTPAQLQGFLLNRRGSASDAAREVAKWAEKEKKALDLAKKKAKDAAAWRNKKRKGRTLEKLAKTLEKVAKDEKRVERDEEEIDDELKKIAKDVERKRERKRGRGGEQIDAMVDGGDEEVISAEEFGEQKEERRDAPVDGGDEKTKSVEEVIEKTAPPNPTIDWVEKTS